MGFDVVWRRLFNDLLARESSVGMATLRRRGSQYRKGRVTPVEGWAPSEALLMAAYLTLDEHRQLLPQPAMDQAQ
jgi:hypothetical protein